MLRGIGGRRRRGWQRMTEDEMAGWHHWLDGCEFEWTLGDGDGQGDLACCDSWGRKESDMTERLNWYKMILNILGIRASLVAQVVKNPPVMQETWVQSLGWEDPLEKETATHSSILAWRIPWACIVHGVAELDTTEWLSLHLMVSYKVKHILTIKSYVSHFYVVTKEHWELMATLKLVP